MNIPLSFSLLAAAADDSKFGVLLTLGLVVLLVIRFAAVPFWSGFHTYGG